MITSLHISDFTTLSELKQEFSKSFPYLKIEFFTKPHLRGMGSYKKDMITKNLQLEKVSTYHHNADIFIESNMTVTELEKLFETNFGLHVQVFRKSGNLWLETTATDNWSLDVQNQQGFELSNANLSNKPDDVDFDSYREQE